MKLSTEDKINTFRSELDLIFNKNIRDFTELCLEFSPDYVFYDCPASSTGKFHHITELGGDGTIIHTKRVVTVGFELCRGLGCIKNRDQIISACIIHDLRKQGLNKSGHTVKYHPDLAAKLVTEIYSNFKLITEEDYNMICKCVGYHYGPWSVEPWFKPLSNYTPEELCVYLSDYIASKKSLTVKYEDRFNE